MVADTEVSFSSLTVELRGIDAKVGVGRRAVSNSFVFATKAGEIWVMGIVAIQDDDVRVHAEEIRFRIKIRFEVAVGKIRWEKIGQSSGVNWETVEGFVP